MAPAVTETRYCRYCLAKLEDHRLGKKAYFKCAKGPVGWLSWKDHTFVATEDTSP
jgi:hypothetical protein